MEPWIRYLVALVVGFHGLVYLIAPRWTEWGSWTGSSAVLGGAVTGDSLKALTGGLWAIAGVGFLGAAVTIALAPWVPSLWRPLAVGAGLIGVLSFVVFWDGQVQLLVDEGAIGLVLSLAVLLGAAAFPQAFS